MRALTVRQPWAWAIIHAGKDVENRTRNLAGDYRGPIAIHSSKTHDEDDYYDVANLLAFTGNGHGVTAATSRRTEVVWTNYEPATDLLGIVAPGAREAR